MELVEEVGRRVSHALNALYEVEVRTAGEARAAEAARRAAALQVLTSALAAQLSVEQIAECVLVDSRQVLGITGGVLSQYEPADGSFRHVRIEGPGPHAGMDWPEAEVRAPTLRALAVRHGEPIFVSSASELRQLVGQEEMRALVAVSGEQARAVLPLLSGRSPLGTLVLNFAAGHRFGAEQRSFLVGVAAQTAQAMDRARRHQLEHHVAEALQRSLLPRGVSDPPGVTTATRYFPASNHVLVGGDWYDVIPLPDGRTALVVGDVVGHDVRAAGFMGRLRAQLSVCLLEHPSAAGSLSALSRLSARPGEGTMATVAVAIWDNDARSLRVSLAGHLPPLLVEHRSVAERGSIGRQARFIYAPLGPPIGATRAEHHYGEGDFIIPAESHLLMYSDGLVERRGEVIDQGMDRLRMTFEGCVSASRARQGGARQNIERVADCVVRQLLGGRADDDTFILLARLAPGPQHVQPEGHQDPSDQGQWKGCEGAEGAQAHEGDNREDLECHRTEDCATDVVDGSGEPLVLLDQRQAGREDGREGEQSTTGQRAEGRTHQTGCHRDDRPEGESDGKVP